MDSGGSFLQCVYSGMDLYHISHSSHCIAFELISLVGMKGIHVNRRNGQPSLIDLKGIRNQKNTPTSHTKVQDSSFLSRRRGRSARLGLNKSAPARGALVAWSFGRADCRCFCHEDEFVTSAGLDGASCITVSMRDTGEDIRVDDLLNGRTGGESESGIPSMMQNPVSQVRPLHPPLE